MPNWCENKLEVTGPKKDRDEFQKNAQYKGSAFALSAFFPMPEELRDIQSPIKIVKAKELGEAIKERDEMVKKNPEYTGAGLPITKATHKKLINKYGVANWYDWAYKNWGIKWDVKIYSTAHTKTALNYSFDSPWAPPGEQFWQLLTNLYPDLTFHLMFEEPGMAFRGEMTAHDGKVDTEHEDYTPEDPE